MGTTMRSVCLAGLVLAVAGCGATSGAVKDAQSVAYDGDLDAVWSAVLLSLRDTYPVARVLDKEKRQVVTCWRPIDHDPNAGGMSGVGHRLFRVIVEISAERPYRVAVSGRAAELHTPLISPIPHDDVREPGWTHGRTERVMADIHARLKQFSRPAQGSAPAASDPEQEETFSDTCVIRAQLVGLNPIGMKGFLLGEAGAANLTTPN